MECNASSICPILVETVYAMLEVAKIIQNNENLLHALRGCRTKTATVNLLFAARSSRRNPRAYRAAERTSTAVASAIAEGSPWCLPARHSHLRRMVLHAAFFL